jgi:hypothetical protein
VNIIKQLQAALPQGQVVIGTPEVRALRIYLNNKKRHAVAPIEKFCSDLSRAGPWPLEKTFLEESIPWLKDLVFRKDGEVRKTPQAQRLNARAQGIVRDLDTILWAGMAVIDFWKETKKSYAVFKAVDKAGDGFCFYYIPWQASEDPARTGLFPLSLMTEML